MRRWNRQAQETKRLDSTDAAGELEPGGRCGGKQDVESWPRWKKTWPSFERHTHVKATLSDSTRQFYGERIHDLRNRMP